MTGPVCLSLTPATEVLIGQQRDPEKQLSRLTLGDLTHVADTYHINIQDLMEAL